ncbi:MAG TPA: prepilin-type N-terminal cleavage/methylation domain-containing protein [Planctomycetaceae bacterium]|nr:prepilin-type N-terminal cleavage/methylation domain-containing protein [Planctomycetaceae bacterium]
MNVRPRLPSRRRAARTGFSLVELLVVIAVGSVVMGIAVGLTLVVFQVQKRCEAQQGQLAVLGRLAEQFRRDVHAATVVRPLNQPDRKATDEESGPETGWEIQLQGDRAVRYRLGRNAVERVELAGSRPTTRESYRLPAGAEALVETEEDDSETLVSLLVVRSGARRAPVGLRELRIVAAVGRDLRFRQPTSRAEAGE